MASIDCAKYTSGQVGGLKVHFDQDKRLECDHENPHIDKNKTHLNSFLDCSGYSEMLRRQRERVANVDELHPPERVRKDRITAVMMEIPVPKSISDKGLTETFLRDIYAMIGKMIGKENMCGMTVHRDEIHDYIDHGGKVRTSLEHGHAMVVPYAHWTAKETVYGADGKPMRDEHGKILKQDVKREGVNAKHFLTRSFLQKLQDRTQEMVLERYGISYQTSQEPLHMTVEELKQESARAAAIIDRAEEHAEQIEADLKPLRDLQVEVKDVNNQGKAIFPGITAIKTKDFEVLKEQAKAYTANKDELADVRQRSDALRSKELEVEQKLTYLDQRIGEVNKSYDEQLNLNRLYHELQKENKKLKSTVLELDDVNKALNAELSDLRAGIGKLKENFNRELQNLKTRLVGAYKALTSVVKAVGMLKYDKEDGYMVEGLTKKQDRLIDGVAEYAVERAKAEGLHDLAGDMEKHIGISAELAPHVKVKDDRKHNHDNHVR